MASALADDSPDVRMIVSEFGGELRVASCLFKCIEVGALDILDDRELQGLTICELQDNNGDTVLLRALGGAPPTFPGDNFVSVARIREGPNDNRLYYAALPNGGGQVIEICLIEILPWISNARPNELDRDLLNARYFWPRRLHFRIAKQSSKAATKSLTRFMVTGGRLGHEFGDLDYAAKNRRSR
jgi:hypothetical protein